MLSYFKERIVLLYFTLVIIVSWASIYAVIGLDGMLGRVALDDSAMPAMMLAMISGPLVASITCILVKEGPNGFPMLLQNLKFKKVSLKWYSIALFTAPILTLCTILLMLPFSDSFIPSILESPSKLSIIMGGLMGGLIAGLFEEIGWTYIVTTTLLKKYGIVISSTIIGLFWGLWHAPLFMAGDPTGFLPLFVVIASRLFTQLPIFRLLMVWVYDKTQSLLISVLMHMMLTASTLIFQAPSISAFEGLIFNLTFMGLGLVTYLIFQHMHGIRETS